MENKMSSEFEDQPIPLVDLKDDGTLEISEQALDFLSALKNQKISILTINGPKGTGKSFLANTFLDKMSGFNCKGDTKGLWMWGRPIELPNKSKLIIIDTQGLENNPQDQVTQKLFILSILISTCLIYNTKNELNDETINLFTQYAELANKISIDEENKGNNNLEQLSEYFPNLIWTIRDYKNEKDSNIYLDENLNKNGKGGNIKKLFPRRECYYIPPPTDSEDKNKNLAQEDISILSPDFKGSVTEIFNKIKTTIKSKKINNFDIDGDSLFGILQNYLDAINNEENPIILKAMENVLLSKGKYSSEKIFDDFKTELNKQLEGKYPMSASEIYKIYFDLVDKQTMKFCEDVIGTLTVKQAGDFLTQIYGRMRDELSNVMDTNSGYYEEWFGMEYNEMDKTLSEHNISKLEDMKTFFTNYLQDFKNGLMKFTEMPNTEHTKSVINIIIKLYNDLILSKLSLVSENLTEMYSTYSKDTSSVIDNLNGTIKKLVEQIAGDKKNFELKLNQTSELNRTNLELESKYDKLVREMKAKEKEYQNNINIEVQKFQKMENYYINQIKEKESVNASLESKIEKANKDLSEAAKENSSKISDLNREILKLNVEIERLKGEKKGSSSSLDSQGLSLQTLFKGIQNTFMEFKESIDKLDREKENVFKTRYLESSTKEIETKSKNWIEEIRLYREDQMKALNDNYEKAIKKVKDEVEELNFEITKKTYSLNEQIQITDNYKEKVEESNQKIQEMKVLSDAKESVIRSQNENIQLMEDRITELRNDKENLELKLNSTIVDFKMKEDELETVILAVEHIFTKKKDKFKATLDKLSNEIKTQLLELAQNYKFFK